MNWIKRFNAAIGYVEENLTERLDPAKVAEEAYTSTFHFQRMFHILTGVTLAEYVRRRRLTLAARDIMDGTPILDTAIKYGYETQASFTRAFSRLHGFTPGTTREPGVRIKAFPPMSFQLTMKGEHAMDYEIRKLGAFSVTGHVRRISTVDGKNFQDIPKFWEEMGSSGKVDEIQKFADPKGVLKGATLGICMDFQKDLEQFNYVIGVEPAGAVELSGVEERTIPAGTWAVFPGKGIMPDAIQAVWNRIFQEWFPATNYAHAEGPELEIYRDAEDGSDECPFEVWIPIEEVD